MLDRIGPDALTPSYGYPHESTKTRTPETPETIVLVPSRLRGRRRDGADRKRPRRDRVRSLAQVCAAGRHPGARCISAVGHGDRGGVAISNWRGDRFRTPARIARTAGSGCRPGGTPASLWRRDVRD